MVRGTGDGTEVTMPNVAPQNKPSDPVAVIACQLLVPRRTGNAYLGILQTCGNP